MILIDLVDELKEFEDLFRDNVMKQNQRNKTPNIETGWYTSKIQMRNILI